MSISAAVSLFDIIVIIYIVHALSIGWGVLVV